MWGCVRHLLALAACARATIYENRAAAETMLHDELFRDPVSSAVTGLDVYDPNVAPSPHGGLVVKVGFHVLNIMVDSDDLSARVSGWMQRNWVDERLSWNTSEYRYYDDDGAARPLATLTRPFGYWRPDLELYEAVAEAERIDGVAHVGSDGFVQWSNPEMFTFRIKLVTKDFPYDRQTLRFTLGATGSRPEKQDLEWIDHIGVDVSSLDKLNDWTVKSASWGREVGSHYSSYAVPYLTAAIEIRRESHFYIRTIVMPNIVITAMGLVAQAIIGWSRSSEIAAFAADVGYTVALTLTAQNLFTADLLPRQRDPTYAELSFVVSLVVTCVSTLLSVMRFHYYRKRDSEKDGAEAPPEPEGPPRPLSKREMLNHLKGSVHSESYNIAEYPFARFVWDLSCIPTVSAVYVFLMRHYAEKRSASDAELKALDSYLSPLLIIVVLVSAFDIWASRKTIHAWLRGLYRAWMALELEEEKVVEIVKRHSQKAEPPNRDRDLGDHLRVLEDHLTTLRAHFGADRSASSPALSPAGRAADVERGLALERPAAVAAGDDFASCSWAAAADAPPDATLRQRPLHV